VTNGELVLGSAENAMLAGCVIPAAGPVAALPPLDALLPHRAPMRLVTAIAGEHVDGLDCLACVPAACALVRNGRACVVAGIEAAAQAAAAWEALRRWRISNAAAGPRIGYLVAMRDVEFSAQGIPAERAFVVRVRLETATPPLTYYRFTVSLDGSALAQGLFATFMTP
jgi:predicted hotdog family 3-hydroxylacyl-ACP dehydratase